MVAILIPIALMYLAPQGEVTKPTFEVASVKPATALGPMGMQVNRKGGPGTADPGMYTCENCPVSWVLSEATSRRRGRRCCRCCRRCWYSVSR